jgi:hypothetical protein
VARPATGSFARNAPVARPASGTYAPSASPSAPPVARPATGSFTRGGTPPVARPATAPVVRTPSGAVLLPAAGTAAAPPSQAEAAGIEFMCPACAVRVRIPGHYLGKSILCPRCSTPQKVVDASGPVRPMDTTRALRGVREAPERTEAPAAVETRVRPDTTDIVPQQATVLPGQALEPEPNTAHAAGDSALTRSDGGKRPSGLVPSPPLATADEVAASAPGAGSPRRAVGAGRTAVPSPAAAVPAPVLPPPLPARGPLLATSGAALLLLLGLVAMVVLWRAAESRLTEQRDQLELLRAERAQAQSDRLKLEAMMAQLQRSLTAAAAAGLPSPLPGASEAAVQPSASAAAQASAQSEPPPPAPALPATAPFQ